MVYGPPTGKHCREFLHQPDLEAESQPAESETGSTTDEVLPILLQLQAHMVSTDEKWEVMEQRMRAIEDTSAGSVTTQNTGTSNAAPAAEMTVATVPISNEGGSQTAAATVVAEQGKLTPSTLRQHARIMKEASEKLERMTNGDDSLEFEDTQDDNKTRGKKSGATMVASDKVVEQIDWPHMYVYRHAGEKRKEVPFGELSVEEFVFGFISMLESPS